MRAELAEAPELQAEYDEYDLMLGRVREAMPLQEVSPNIHASILEAARAAAQQPDDRLIRRTTPDKQSFWQRMSSGQGSRVALVAAVLIAGAFVVRFVDKSDSPLHAPASDISAMREAAPAAPALAASEQAAQGAAVSENEEQVGLPEAEPEPTPTGGEAIADQWSPDEDPAPPMEEAKAESPEDSLRQELRRSNRAREDKAEAQKPAPAPEPAATKSAPRPKKNARSYKGSKSKDAKKLDDLLNADDSGFGSSSTRQPQVQGKAGLEAAAEEAEGEAVSADAPSEYRPAPGTISEVDAYFRRGDYGGAITAADEFLEKGNGSKSETANAMFIKAQSLAKQNQTVAAERLLQRIKKSYPDFRSAEVDQQLQELQRRTAPKKQRRKAKPKPKLDEVEKSAPDSMYNLK